MPEDNDTAPTHWRPLGFGEIFDRAITLYVRNFIPFIGLVLIIAIPTGLYQYYADSTTGGNAILALFSQNAASGQLPPMLASPDRVGFFLIGVVVAIVFELFAYNAIAVGVARLYGGRAIAFRACYRTVFSRSGTLIGTLLLCALLGIVLYVCFVILGTLILVPVVLLARGTMIATIVIGVVGGVALLFASVAGVVVFAAMAFAFYGVAIERMGAVTALGAGFARVFSRREFWRAAGIVVCSFVITFVASMLVAGMGALAGLLHQPWLSTLVVTSLSLAISPYGIILMAVYYYDVRIRHEGIDLEAKMERLVAGDVVPA